MKKLALSAVAATLLLTCSAQAQVAQIPGGGIPGGGGQFGGGQFGGGGGRGGGGMGGGGMGGIGGMGDQAGIGGQVGGLPVNDALINRQSLADPRTTANRAGLMGGERTGGLMGGGGAAGARGAAGGGMGGGMGMAGGMGMMGGAGGMGAGAFGAGPFDAQGMGAAPPVRSRLRADIQVSTAAVQNAGTQTQRRITGTPIARRIGNFSVSLNGGVAVLTGVAPSEHDRRMAAMVMQLEPGIRQIDNRITVSP